MQTAALQRFSHALIPTFVLVFCAALSLASAAHAEKRVALVIGNAAYTQVSQLANPSNDARDVAAALRRLNFEVIEGIDLNKAAMSATIRKFSAAIDDADVALFYYAGHGLQVGGQNYLAPVDAKIGTMRDLDFDAVPLSLVLRQMERKKRTNLVFLDACRNNPLMANLSRSLGSTRSASMLGRGLARVETGVGTLISYSTQPGNVALDGKGRNSPFTTALLKHIETPAIDIADLMISVRRDVLKISDGKQVPWENSSLTGQFYFKPRSIVAEAKPQSVPEARPPVVRQFTSHALEIAFWNSVKDSKDAGYFEAYLEKYPNGEFAALARRRMQALSPPDKTPPPTDNLAPKETVTLKSQPPGGPPAPTDDGARKDPPQDKAPPPTDHAALTPPDKAPRPENNTPNDDGRFIFALQSELKRIGCYAGGIDGDWGARSRAALRRYNRNTGQKLNAREPSPTALKTIKDHLGIVCRQIVRRDKPRRAKKRRNCVVDNSTPNVMESAFARDPWRRVC